MEWEDYFSPCDHPHKEGVWIRFCELRAEYNGDLLKIAEEFGRGNNWLFLAHLKDTETLEFIWQRANDKMVQSLLLNPNLPTSVIRKQFMMCAVFSHRHLLKLIAEHPNTDAIIADLLKGEY
jgi:hypothetical protein